MGNSTGSMFYLFAIVIVVYIIGASAYSLFQWLKKRRSQKKDEKPGRAESGKEE